MFCSTEFYSDIESIMYRVGVVCVCFSVKSVIESMGSSYEYHSRKIRDLSQQQSTRELFISWNGPFLDQADNLIKEAISAHWGAGKHAHCAARRIGDYTVSKAISSKVEAHKKSRFPFMK